MDTVGDPGRPVRLRELLDRLGPESANLVLHDPDGPAECLVRAGELVALPEAADEAERRLGSRVDRMVAAGPDAVRIILRPDVRERAVDLAVELGPAVTAHHVHLGSPIMFGTPIIDSRPNPAAPVPPPEDERWQPAVTVAVLDTGLDPHPWFAGRPWFSEWGLSPEALLPERDPMLSGHGTFVTGVLLRHAPGVTVRHQRSLSAYGFTDDVTVAAALREVRTTAAVHAERLDIVLLTSGCQTPDDRCPPLLRRQVERCGDTIVVASAGNFGSDRPFWPAALPEVIAVAATDSDGTLAPFSDHGDWVDAAAPGVDVVSSYVRAVPATEGDAPGTASRVYGAAIWSGTSFAAPVIAAELARLLHDGVPVERAREAVCRRNDPFVRKMDHQGAG